MHHDDLSDSDYRKRADTLNYRANKTGQTAVITPAILRGLLIRAGCRCDWCGQALDTDFEFDHIIALSSGGENTPENLVVTCQVCNRRKSNRHPAQWAAEMAAQGILTAHGRRLLEAHGIAVRKQSRLL